jgi:hypothetical protein
LRTHDHVALETRQTGKATADSRYGSDRGPSVHGNGNRDVRIDVRQDERARYSCLQAARHGDRQAFADLCAELRGPLSRRAQRQLTSEGRDITPAAVDDLVERVFLAAFDEMPDKPDNWSTYGWMSWLVEREIAAGERTSRSRR